VERLGLDEVDSKILRILLEDARASISKIAEELGVSRPTVRKRMRKLVELGIIKRFTVIIDENLLKGFQVLASFKASNAEKLVRELKKMDEILEIYLTTGERNVVCIARIADLKTLEDLLNKFSKFDVSFEVSIILRTEKKPVQTALLHMIKLSCDYCGKEITGKPLVYTLHNRKYYLCCPTCLREFNRKMRRR